MVQTKPVALVTGSSNRIGAAIATDLAENGFATAVHCRSDVEEAEELCSNIRAKGGLALPFRADLSEDKSVRSLIAAVSESLGPVVLLINNASIFEDDRATEFDRQKWDDHFAVHLRAPALLAEAMANELPQDRNGLIVNIIDQRVWRLTPNFFSYTLSKSALWTATKTMAQALAPRIRVNAIGPGPSLPSPRQTEEEFEKLIDLLPLQRGPQLTEFGQTIRYFWNAPSVTGQMIALDGGQHLAWQTPDVTNISE